MYEIMSKKLNSMPDYQARMPKQPHNMSQSFAFTASTGMELPCYYDMLHIGDEIFFDAGLFARLNPIYAPFIGDVDIHLDYFFVPLSVMFTPSLSLFYQTNDLLYESKWKNSTHFPTYSIVSALSKIKVDGVNRPSFRKYSTGTHDFSTTAFDCVGKGAVRLCDMLEYNWTGLFSAETTFEDFNPHSTPWFLCAYHACHQLYFRNEDREPKSYIYQLDNEPLDGTNIDDGELLTLNYRSSYKDYFNSVKVSPIGSSVSMLNGVDSWNMLSKVNSYLFNDSNPYRRSSSSGNTVGVNDVDATSTGTFISPIATNPTALQTALNSANIRQLFMVDKMLRVTGRADKNYESQFLAHFGIKMPHDDFHSITHIGHDMFTLNTQTVQSTANTYNSSNDTGSALGEIGGQGFVSGNGKKRKFKAPFHGVFMCIFSAVPRFRYTGERVNKLHDLSEPMSFWQPEYDKRGMQPLFAYECYPTLYPTRRAGWQFGYEQFKRKYDRASYAFNNPSYLFTGTVNMYSPWVLSHNPFRLPNNGNFAGNVENGLDFDAFYSTPHDLDGVMQVKYQSVLPENLNLSNLHTIFQTDPFIVDFRMQCKKVNCMSEYSEPPIE